MTKPLARSASTEPSAPSPAALAVAALQTPTLEEDLLKLTTEQRAYTEHRAKGLGPEAAARAAGYEGEKSHLALEKHPRIQRILQSTAREALSRLSFSRDDVLAGLMDAVHAAANSTELTGAWREIGKMIGAYEPEVVKHKHEITKEHLQVLSEEELIALAGEEDFRLDPEGEAALEAEFEVLSTTIEEISTES